MHPISRLLYAAYFLESGFLLVVVPWSAFWERNLFNDLWPPLRALVLNHFFRGAVTGLGMVNVVAGLADLSALLGARRATSREQV